MVDQASQTPKSRKKKVLGTGKIKTDRPATDKWITGMVGQANTQEVSLNVKQVPVEMVVPDPHNPRELAISIQDIRAVTKEQAFDEQARGDVEGYLQRTDKFFSGKARDDFEALCYFAASLGSSENLLNPIVVWLNDNTFNLVAGERRLLVHVLLDEPSIASRILDKAPVGYEKIKLQWEENYQRLDLSLPKRIKNLATLVDAWSKETGETVSVNSFKDLAGCARSVAQRYLAVIRCEDKRLHQAIADENITNIKKAAVVAGMTQEERDEYFHPTAKQAKPKPAFTVGKFKNYSPFKTIIDTTTKSLGSKVLAKEIAELDLNSQQGVTKAFELLIGHIESKE